MMSRVDLPEVLLEIFARTGVVDCFTHISGATTRMDELEVSLCAVLLSEAANFGLRPVIDPAVRALTRGRLRHVDAAYKRLETISAANARFIACQAEIPIVQALGRRDGRLGRRGGSSSRSSRCGQDRTRGTSGYVTAARHG